MYTWVVMALKSLFEDTFLVQLVDMILSDFFFVFLVLRKMSFLVLILEVIVVMV